MNEPGHNERMLADVLGEGIAPGFREGLLRETLRLARRRRRVRQVRRGASLLAVLAVIGLVVRHELPSSLRPMASPAKPYALVRTQPLPAAAWVETKPLPAASIVASVATGNIILTAQIGSPVRQLNDDELLALAPKPAALVRLGPHSAELVLVNQEDREELLRN